MLRLSAESVQAKSQLFENRIGALCSPTLRNASNADRDRCQDSGTSFCSTCSSATNRCQRAMGQRSTRNKEPSQDSTHASARRNTTPERRAGATASKRKRAPATGSTRGSTLRRTNTERPQTNADLVERLAAADQRQRAVRAHEHLGRLRERVVVLWHAGRRTRRLGKERRQISTAQNSAA